MLDTVGWEAPLPKSGKGISESKPLTHDLPPVTRPEGLKALPYPKELPDKIHVLLSRGDKSLSIYSLGELQILAEMPELTKLKVLRGSVQIRRAANDKNAIFEIVQGHKVIETTNAHRLRLLSVNPFNLIDVDGKVYRGSMHLIAEKGPGITSVNVLGVDDYLRGVVPYEMGTVGRDGLEALKAQAMVARTYAFRRMLHPSNPDFHVFSDVKDQVYKGVKGEYLLSDRAVWETRNMAVTSNDSLIQCYYFSTCSGRTASKHEVWGGDSIPYLVSRIDTDGVGEAYCLSSKYSAWNEEWSIPQLTGILKRNLRSAGIASFQPFSSIENIIVTDRASCGRVRVLNITTDKGNIQVKGDKSRFALRQNGSEVKILPSAWFDIEVKGNKVIAQGHGYGHGVGLCQVGAIGRAKAGQSFKQIIDAYYTGVTIVEYK